MDRTTGKEEISHVDRPCPHEDIFARVPQMAARIDPILRQLDHLLDDDGMYQAVRADFGHRHRRTLSFGRPSTSGETLLRMLLLKHLYDWSFQETEDQVDQNPGSALVLLPVTSSLPRTTPH